MIMKKAILVVSTGFIIGIFLTCSKGTGNKPIESGMAGKGDPGYTYKISIEKMQFDWAVAGDTINVMLKGQTNGWVGIGFNSTNGMKDGNFILGMYKNGQAVLTNQHGTASTMHKKNVDLGGNNHIKNPSGSEKNGVTEIAFTYPLKTGGRLDRPIDVKEKTIVLLAHGPSKELSQVHSFRAKLEVNLSTGKYSVLLMTGK
jgi:hypothetical protein